MRKILVMGRIIGVGKWELAEIENKAKDFGFTDAGTYLDDVLGKKWGHQDGFTLAEVIRVEIDALANE